MSEFTNKIEELKRGFTADIADVSNADELEAVRLKYLGRKSAFQEVLRSLKDVPADQRKEFGVLANDAKGEIEAGIDAKEKDIEMSRFDNLATEEKIDITLPGVEPPKGHLHLVTTGAREIQEIFERIGFTRVPHKDVEWEKYVFDDLRVGTDHPARDNWETYFVDTPADAKMGRMILSPHVTSGDVPEMLKGDLPIRMFKIGKTYRRQSDVSHVPMFHQFEGLLVDKGITLSHLKGVLDYFAKTYFGPERTTRLRPHNFRFTEPSFEVDISCGVCMGKEDANCRMCKDGWLELGGSGMIHPDVLRAGGIDPDEYSALAFGWGLERTITMRDGINIADLRTMYKNDVRFLEQF